MRVRVWFRDEPLETLTAHGSDLRRGTPAKAAVTSLLLHYGGHARGEDLLRLLVSRVRGHVWAEEIRESSSHDEAGEVDMFTRRPDRGGGA